jgi:hypothetical protein
MASYPGFKNFGEKEVEKITSSHLMSFAFSISQECDTKEDFHCRNIDQQPGLWGTRSFTHLVIGPRVTALTIDREGTIGLPLSSQKPSWPLCKLVWSLDSTLRPCIALKRCVLRWHCVKSTSSLLSHRNFLI